MSKTLPLASPCNFRRGKGSTDGRSAAQPDRARRGPAAARAAHPVVDREPLIFRDPVAADLIGEPGAEMVGYHRRSGDHIVLAGTRAQVTVRSRYTERRLAELADQGLDQYVSLGAGLDSFAYRSPLAGRLRVFEVDHPATQRWKRDLLAAGTELVLEYALPSRLRDQAGADYAGFALPVAEERGEPWLSFFTPEQLSGLLEDHGMKVAEQARQQDAVPAALWRRSDALRPLDLCRLARATVSP
jgi:O-methyltransferase involved in polyketide biosynthesis